MLIPVALRKESVDRNMGCPRAHLARGWSLSARRAWIEMPIRAALARPCVVALRKESVDRNAHPGRVGAALCRSLSARRAWIEMRLKNRKKRHNKRSLSARRAWIEI